MSRERQLAETPGNRGHPLRARRATAKRATASEIQPNPENGAMGRAGKTMAAGAVLLVGGCLTGLVGTMLAFTQAFNRTIEAGRAEDSSVEVAVSDALVSTEIGLLIAGVGLCLLIGGFVASLVGRSGGAESSR